MPFHHTLVEPTTVENESARHLPSGREAVNIQSTTAMSPSTKSPPVDSCQREWQVEIRISTCVAIEVPPQIHAEVGMIFPRLFW